MNNARNVRRTLPQHAAAKGVSTGPVYATTKPNTKFQAPPAQDLSTEYDVVKGFKSQEGPV